MYNGQKIDSEHSSIYFNSDEEINIETTIEVFSTLKNKKTKKLNNKDFQIETDLVDDVQPGDEFYFKITYKKFNAITLSIFINKLENTISFQNTSKTYDGSPFTTMNLGITASNEEGLTIEWL